MTKFKNLLLLQNHWANFKQTWCKASLSEVQIRNIQSQKGGVFFSLLINIMVWSYLLYICLLIGTVSQVRDMTHGPLVFWCFFWEVGGNADFPPWHAGFRAWVRLTGARPSWLYWLVNMLVLWRYFLLNVLAWYMTNM